MREERGLVRAALVGWALLGVLNGCDTPGETRRCLGSAALCERAYDDVSYFTSHNAMSNEVEGWFVPNHLVPVADQLDLGVRALMLDVHEDAGAIVLCHGTCLAGMEPLKLRLEALRLFLEEHPTEILSLILESYVPAADVAEVFEAAGLAPFLHTQPVDAPWPTVGELVDTGERLVVFTDLPQGGPSWMHPMWEHAFETHFHAEAKSELSCDVNRGDPNHRLFILNHFLTNPFAHTSNATQLNEADFVVERATDCWAAHDRRPNFVTIDFASIGDVGAAVEALNLMETP